MKKWDCLRLLQISLVSDLIEDCRGFISACVSSLLPNKVSHSTPVKWRRQQHPRVMKIVLISWTLWKGLGCAGKQALQKGKKKRKPRTQGLYKCQFLWYKFPPPTIASYQLDSTSAEVGERHAVRAGNWRPILRTSGTERLWKNSERPMRCFQETNNPVTGEQGAFLTNVLSYLLNFRMRVYLVKRKEDFKCLLFIKCTLSVIYNW